MTVAQPGLPFTLLVFAGVIGTLVFVHEFGHYYVARLCGVRSETFSIGFGRAIASWTDARGTCWKLGWLPLGGYVKFVGDANEASQPDASIERTPLDQRRGLFHFAPLWQKAAITLAGPATNFLFAILIYAAFFAAYGKIVTSPVIGSIVPGTPAAASGLKAGDRVTSIDGKPVERFEDLLDRTVINVGDPMQIGYVREGQKGSVTIVPRQVSETDAYGNSIQVPRLGIRPNGQQTMLPVSAFSIIPAAVTQVGDVVRSQAVGLWQIASGRRSVKDMGGPIKMAQISGQVAAVGWLNLVELIAVISINLGFINLLPVPMLDGGHLFLYALQAVRRRPLGARVQEWAFMSGFVALVSLMVMLTWNDLGSIGVWKHITGLLG